MLLSLSQYNMRIIISSFFSRSSGGVNRRLRIAETRFPLFLLLIIIFSACKTPPRLVTFFVSEGVNQYFLSPTEWAAKGSKAVLNVTYRTGTDTPAIVNISFFGNKSTPINISSVSLNGVGVNCPLENVSVLLTDNGKNELRISATGDKEAFVAVLSTGQITLTAEVDGTVFVYTPEKRFFNIANEFLASL